MDVAAGVGLAVIAGILFAAVGGVLKRLPPDGSSTPSYYLALGLFTLAAALLRVRWSLLAAGHVPRLGQLVAVMGASGIFTAIGMSAMTAAMGRGHGGISWAISQSAMIVPFVLSVAVFGDRVGAAGGIGMVLLFAMVAVLGARGGTARGTHTGRGWFLVVAAAFLSLGASQALSIIPQRWPGWTDTANLRIAVSSAFFLATLALAWLVKGGRPIKGRIALLALAHAALGFSGQVALFRAIDLLNPHGLVALCHPLSTGATILSFSIYSRVALGERFRTAATAALAAGLLGLLFLAVGSLPIPWG